MKAISVDLAQAMAESDGLGRNTLLVTVAANAVVVGHVGNNEVVVGNPTRVVSAKGSEGYVKWTSDE